MFFSRRRGPTLRGRLRIAESSLRPLGSKEGHLLQPCVAKKVGAMKVDIAGGKHAPMLGVVAETPYFAFSPSSFLSIPGMVLEAGIYFELKQLIRFRTN